MRWFPDARGMRAIRRAVLWCCVLLACVDARAQRGVDAARGATKAAACVGCHGSVERPPKDGVPLLAGQQREFLVLQMFYMREGLRDVPQMKGSLKGYTDRDLEDVAAYYS